MFRRAFDALLQTPSSNVQELARKLALYTDTYLTPDEGTEELRAIEADARRLAARDLAAAKPSPSIHHANGSSREADCPKWAEAMKNLEEARAAESAYDAAVWIPAFNASKSGGPSIPIQIDEEAERLMELRYAAEEVVIRTPAPTLSAAVWKVEYSHKRWDGQLWPDDWWASAMGDLQRLANEEC